MPDLSLLDPDLDNRTREWNRGYVAQSYLTQCLNRLVLGDFWFAGKVAEDVSKTLGGHCFKFNAQKELNQAKDYMVKVDAVDVLLVEYVYYKTDHVLKVSLKDISLWADQIDEMAAVIHTFYDKFPCDIDLNQLKKTDPTDTKIYHWPGERKWGSSMEMSWNTKKWPDIPATCGEFYTPIVMDGEKREYDRVPEDL